MIAEYAQYSPCPRHGGALERLGFSRALDIAEDCPDCITLYISGEDHE